MLYPNRNAFWAAAFVDVLAQSGLRTAVIAPGSRSTPLTVAFAEHPDVEVVSLLDERSVAFFALGMSLATDSPTAIVCSSGTATANFFPAIVEANMSRVPLLVLTADRPPELRHSGANQTIDQIKLYGDFALWSVDVALPEADPPEVAVRNLRGLAARAYATANGLRKGVVHLNFPFRKPLEPTSVEGDVPREIVFDPVPRIIRATVGFTDEHINQLSRMVEDSSSGVIVCGPKTGFTGEIRGGVAEFAAATGFPVLVDGTSDLRFAPPFDDADPYLGLYDWYLGLEDVPEPELVIRLGGVPTSKALMAWLDRIRPKYRVLINEHGEWMDDTHRLNWLFQVEPGELLSMVSEVLPCGQTRSASLPQLREAETIAAQVLEHEVHDEFFDGAVVTDMVDLLPDGSRWFVGNSLPVRHLDQFAAPTRDKRVRVYANRGASGIDGEVSTMLGVGRATSERVFGLLGDITTYHDLNGLLAVKRTGVKATIVVLNNDGGGIFHRLPMREFDPPYTDLFRTPHGLTFEHAAAMYGLQYTHVDDRKGFRSAFADSLESDESVLIEVKTDVARDAARRQALMQLVKQRIQEKLKS